MGTAAGPGSRANHLITVAVSLAGALMAVGSVRLWFTGRRGALFGPRPKLRADPDEDPRWTARVLLETRPDLASEQGVGRSDLPRDFDDGGLVDVNHLPAEFLVSLLGWSTARALAVVAVREDSGLFLNATDLIARTPLGRDEVLAVADLVVYVTM